MKPRMILWIGVGIAIACVSGCASTGESLKALKDSPAAVRQTEKQRPEQGRNYNNRHDNKALKGSPTTARPKSEPDPVQRRDYDTSRSMATIRYYGRIGQGIDKALQRTETIQRQLDAIQRRK